MKNAYKEAWKPSPNFDATYFSNAEILVFTVEGVEIQT